MWRFQPIFSLLLLCLSTLAHAQGSGNTSSLWKTLDGKAPLVIARGGFSGIFPDSCENAYQLAGILSLPNVSYWCDVQLTKDGVGICFPDLTLQNGTDIEFAFKDKEATHIVNGKSVQGWFSLDFTLNDLSSIPFTQEIFSRSPYFDGTQGSVLTVQEVNKIRHGQGLWLNIQHDAFFSQNNLSMRTFTLSILRTTVVDYISSPEVSFLRSIVARKPPRTKLVFRFLEKDDIEPSTNQTYGTLLGNLTFIKTFASGILVPKGYIWPVDTEQYLLPSTALVSDAHTAGLQVFAADFANDIPFAYNFSYDPVAEYLKFVDNGDFSVDGVLSDFPLTPSSAIDCFSHIDENDPVKDTPLIISLGGSSGDFASSTNLAYEKAIKDGADIIDCTVQMTKDGIPICLTNINLAMVTTAAKVFTNKTISIPELNFESGIPTFNVTWSDIQTLQPFLVSPYQGVSSLFRNPRERNAGEFTTLSRFLDIAENSSTVSGALIAIENARYLLEEENLDVIGAVLSTLSNSSYAKTSKRIMIQSSNSAVLTKIKENNSTYELVYRISNTISTADNATITEIKEFATAVVITKSSVFPSVILYIKEMTNVVRKMHAFDLKVYARIFRNEYLSQAWDFLSDATFEINSYVSGGEIDGIVTEFPATAARYRKNRCLKDPRPPYMRPVLPGSLLSFVNQMPPTQAPSPGLTEADVDEPAFPPLTSTVAGPGNTSNQAPPPRPNGQPKMVAGSILISWTALFLAVMSMF